MENLSHNILIYVGIWLLQIDILTYDRKKISGQIEFPVRQMPFIAHNDALRSLFLQSFFIV